MICCTSSDDRFYDNQDDDVLTERENDGTGYQGRFGHKRRDGRP